MEWMPVLYQPYVLFVILLITMALFIWGPWRYDIVAFFALLISVILGVVPPSNVFIGFSNPAVITVACVMVISSAITRSGVLNSVVEKLAPVTKNVMVHVVILTLITAVLSAFMNNIGALALMMPVAIRVVIKSKVSPSLVLMPLAFASVLGGMTTAIGTPPNILISAYREQVTGIGFGMFDYAPVGIVIAVSSIAFITLLGWRLIPYKRKKPVADQEIFQIQNYVTEVIVTKKSAVIGSTIKEFMKLTKENVVIISLIRDKRNIRTLSDNDLIQEKDILIIGASHDVLNNLIHAAKLELVGEKKLAADGFMDHVGLVEVVVPENSRMVGKSSQQLRLRSRYRMNLIAIARQGKPFKERLSEVVLKAGDVVLLQGEADSVLENAKSLGFLPLLERGVLVGKAKRSYLPITIFAGSIALAVTQILPVQIAFAIAVLVMVLLNVMPMRAVHESINWSVIMLLAAMIPIGVSLQLTGGTELIANFVVSISSHMPTYVVLAVLLVITMTLSDFMNNAATTVVMAPIAMSIATALQVNVDTFLMTVAVGASCSFLTPIGHQSNTLVMGPGGYEFSDYFRMGLPIELIVIVIGLPIILFIWPI